MKPNKCENIFAFEIQRARTQIEGKPYNFVLEPCARVETTA